jgi:hypothetical protein
VTSGNLRRPVTSQSTQRNLRPPVFTSTNRIGMLHFGQIGGGEFLGMGSPFHQGGSSTLSVTDNSRKRETVINHPAPFNGPIASQFRAIDTVFRHSALRLGLRFGPLRQHLEPRICQPQPGILIEWASGILGHTATLCRLPSIFFVVTHTAIITQFRPLLKST